MGKMCLVSRALFLGYGYDNLMTPLCSTEQSHVFVLQFQEHLLLYNGQAIIKKNTKPEIELLKHGIILLLRRLMYDYMVPHQVKCAISPQTLTKLSSVQGKWIVY
jgi:hypothetical protein